MSVVASGARERSFRTVLGGFDPEAVRAAVVAAATECERLEAEIALLTQQHADALGAIDRMSELERSLLRSCVAAEEDARTRCGAARRYAARVIAAAEEQGAARLEAPAHERDRITREIDAMLGKRREAAKAIENLIAHLQRPTDAPLPDAVGESETRDAAIAGVAPLKAASGSPELPHEIPLEAPAPRRYAPGLAVERTSATTQAAALADAQPPPAAVAAVGATDTGADDWADRRVPDAADAERQPVAAEKRQGGRFRLAIAAGMPAAVLLILQGSPGVPTRNMAPQTVAAAGFAPAADAPIESAASTAAADPGAGPGAPAPGATPAAATLKIHIKPLRTCWVRVVVDDRTDARELQPGEDIALEAHRSIVLRVGDAGALSIEVNGRVLPPLGLDGQVVERRFTTAPQE